METRLKTEVILIGTRQQLAKVNVTSIAVGDETIEAKPSVRNLGSWFDSQLSMSTHISKVCGAAFYHLHNIGRIRMFLSPDDTKPLVHAFITSRIDYCNNLFYYTTQAVRGPITKINQSKCSITGPIFSKYWTGHCPE